MIGGLRCLEIGPGDCPLGEEGEWDRLDASPIPSVPLNYVCKWGFGRLPINDASYDLVYSSHTIEHIPWYLTPLALREVWRILDFDGDFEVWTIDFAVVVQAYQEKRWVREWDCGGRVRHFMQSIAGHVFAYEKDGNPHMWHKALFDEEYLGELLLNAGFSHVERMEKTRGHDHGPANLGMRATK